MLPMAGRIFGRLALCAPVLAFGLFAGAAPVFAEDGRAGLWEIEAVYKNDVLDRCAISRSLKDDITVTFMKTREELSLLLASPHWKLETGKRYPVTMKLGPQSWDRTVDAEASAVSMVVDDPRFLSGLRGANALDVVAAGETIHVSLSGSAAAFERLDRCAAKNERPAESVADSGGEGPPSPTAKPDARPERRSAEDTAAASENQGPPLPAAKPVVETETGGNSTEDTIAASEGEVPPPPATKPAAESETEGVPTEDAVASEQSPPPPAAKPAIEGEAEGKSTEDAIAASEEEGPPPAAVKPDEAPVEPTVKKVSPKKKRTTQSSSQSAKRAFKREIDRLRRFFGN